MSTTEAKHRLKELAKSVLDPMIVNQYLTILTEMPSSVEGKVDFLLNTGDLVEGMVLTKDILNSDKHPMLTKGTQLEQHHIDKLLEIEKTKNERFLIYAN